MKRMIYLVAMAAVGLVCSCKPSAQSSGQVLTTKAVELTDSLNYGRSSAEVTISGQYPDSGVPVLLDSCRQWFVNCLTMGAFTTSKPLIHPTRAEIADPQRLIAHLSKKILDSARRDFIEFESEPELSAGYEYQISFEPTWISDSIVTYGYTAYSYLGGAHGSTISRVASFAVSTGRTLSYGEVFRPDRLKELVAKIRHGLWVQYFQPVYASEPDGPQSLAEVLLINPDEMELPACNPSFGPNGVTFTYGQYEIAPYAAGQPSCTLIYTELLPLMTEQAANLISRQ